VILKGNGLFGPSLRRAKRQALRPQQKPKDYREDEKSGAIRQAKEYDAKHVDNNDR